MSNWSAVADAVIAALNTGGVTVYDAVPITNELLTGVVVGAVLDDESGRAGEISQSYHELGTGAKRDENGRIFCVALAQSGDNDLSTIRTTAFTTLDAAEDILRATHHLNVDNILRIEVSQGDIFQGYTKDGCFCEIRFDISYHAIY